MPLSRSPRRNPQDGFALFAILMIITMMFSYLAITYSHTLAGVKAAKQAETTLEREAAVLLAPTPKANEP